jgi:phosphoribosyl 1,2-cyclic phosphodiesterase
VRVWSLGSGSSGNALVVESGTHRILLDCGFGPRALQSRLKLLGIAPETIGALVITHEHVDNAQGAERAQHKWRWPVYASAATLDALPAVTARWRRPVRPGAAVALDGFTLEGIAIPHDAAAPLAFAITATATGARLGVAHDLGAVPEALRTAFAGCDALCLEANHDVELLRNGPYPWPLQERIRGGRGHISNAVAGAFLAEVAGRSLRAVALLHLSEVNNTPVVAERDVAALARRGRFRGPVRAAPRRTGALLLDLDRPAAVPGSGPTSVQLALGV